MASRSKIKPVISRVKRGSRGDGQGVEFCTFVLTCLEQ